MAEKLDNAVHEPEVSQDSGLPRPPSGRRAASRPAGPPKQAANTKKANNSAEKAEAPAEKSDASEKKEEASSNSQRRRPARRRRSSNNPKTVSDEAKSESPAEEPSKEAKAGVEPEQKPERENSDDKNVKAEGTKAETQSRRRRRKPTAESEPSPDLEAKLDEVLGTKKNGRGRAERKPASEQVEINKEAALADLTASIAGKSEETEPAKKTSKKKAQHTDQQKDASGSEESSSEAEDSNKSETSSGSRRRRRRGGRRRQSNSNEEDAEATDEAPEAKSEADGSEDKDEHTSGTTRRRRRRRRGGSSSDDGTAIAIRQPRSRAVSDEITSIEGSTRLEAKRQRRREGRSQRRRAPILTEAEFLARRENVSRKMVIRQSEDFTQLAVLEDNMFVEHYVDRKNSTSLIGNIYLGRVQNVLPSMEAVFIDIGRGRNAVLYAGEVNWDAFEVASDKRQVEQVFKSGDTVIVQVSKDPVGAKGARLTGHISLPGRYVVYSPNGHLSGISRKLPDTERSRLKKILDENLGDNASVIVRTAAEGATEENLSHDIDRLKAQWEVIEKKAKRGGAPSQLYAEPDLTLRTIRDIFTEDFEELIIAGAGGQNDAWDSVSQYVEMIAPQLSDRLKKWDTEQGDIFAAYRIDEQISKALERKVFLPSGGSLVIDRTEAMTVIDVNTGKFTGSGGNLEETVTKNNLEAAEEIVRQLRLRDLGGIIVIDFIDMVLPANRDLLLRRLIECLSRDRTRHQVSEVTSLGLVQMTRKRIGTGLAEAFTTECESCGGRGYHRFDTPVASQAPADGGVRHGKRNSRSGKNKAKNN